VFAVFTPLVTELPRVLASELVVPVVEELVTTPFADETEELLFEPLFSEFELEVVFEPDVPLLTPLVLVPPEP